MTTRSKNTEAPANKAAIYVGHTYRKYCHESIKLQLKYCHEYAEREGLQVVKVYMDSASTEMNGERDEFQRMLQDSRKRLFGHLIIHRPGYLGCGSRFVAADNTHTLKENGIKIVSVSDNLPENTIPELFAKQWAEYFAQYFPDEVADDRGASV